MAKIGSYEYPTTQFGTLLKAAEVLVEKFDGSVADERTFAEALGHKTHNSGGWRTKLADMRRYGLLEPRGLDATSTAKRIVKHLTPEERQEEMNKALMNISLWQTLYDKLRKKLPDASDFKITLVQVTNDRDTAVDKSEDIRNLYKDAMSFYSENTPVKKDSSGGQKEVGKSETHHQAKHPHLPPVGENMIEAKSGDVYITIPRSKKSVEIAKKLLGILELQVEEQEETPEKPPSQDEVNV